MTVGIMQPYFFPYLGYWQLINAVDKYVVYDDVTYIKGGWISRNRILLNGEAHMLTLPLDNPSSFRNINEIGITSNIKAREKIVKTLEAAYKKAKYHDIVMPKIESLILNCERISELNYNTILYVKEYLGINTEIILSSELEKDNTLTGQDKVISINKTLGADMYINSIGGKEIYSSEEFRKNGIELRFLEMDNIQYEQNNNAFVSDLSIIDVLMFNSVEQIRELLCKYRLSLGR